MNVGSLFSGIGGLDYGLHQAGFTHEFFCESDPWRREVLAARWPGVPIYGDVRTVDVEPAPRAPRDECGSELDGTGRLHSDAVLDLLCGGFPCQDVSVAGRRAGLAGERSGLFHEFARIIDALRPRWVLVENVPGLLSSNGGRDFGVVLESLADLGYGVAWRVLDSRFFGVPQRRRRVFILGTESHDDPRAAAGRAGEVLAVGSRCPGHPPTGGEARPDVASTLGGSVGKGRGHDGNPFDRGGLSSLSGLGNGGPDDNDAQAERLIAMNLRGREGGAMPELADVASLRSAEGGSSSAIVGVRRLTPIECERLQGLPDGWTQLGDTPDSRRYSGLGDAVTATVAEWIGRRLIAA